MAADERYAFLTDPDHDRILRYDLPQTAPVTILGGAETKLNRPVALALDRHGRLLVANGSDDRILMFDESAAGDVRPVRELHVSRKSDDKTMDIAVTADGTLYVVEGPAAYIGPAPNGTVLRFAPDAAGNVAPENVASVPLTNWVDAP
jgi:sugar lactone lactonase YvrE